MKHEGHLIVTDNNLEYAKSVTSVGRGLYVRAGIGFDHSKIVFGNGDVLAVTEYALHVNKEGEYSASCRGPWGAERALKHWGRTRRSPERAKAFSETIKAHGAALAVA